MKHYYIILTFQLFVAYSNAAPVEQYDESATDRMDETRILRESDHHPNCPATVLLSYALYRNPDSIPDQRIKALIKKHAPYLPQKVQIRNEMESL